MNSFIVILLLLILLVPVKTYAETPFQILILHSYSQEYAWTKSQHNAFTRTLNANSNKTVLISTEYLDTKRKKYDKDYADRFYSYLKDKYSDYMPDLIYVTDDNALDFSLEYLINYFEQSPIIFSGVNNYSIIKNLDKSRITGVFEKKEITPNLKLLKNIDPEIKNILLIGDASNTYIAIENEIKNELIDHPDIHASFISSSEIDILTRALAQHEGEFVFLTTLGRIRDAQGHMLSLDKVISAISQSGKHIISMEDAYLFKGVLGGYVTSGDSQGISAAKLALEIQDGKPPDLIPLITESPNEYIFDHIELKKHSFILPEDIADKSRILNKPPSIYERYKTYILTTIITLVILLIILLSTFLAILSRKNQKIQNTNNIRESLVDRINTHAKQLELEQQKLNQAQAIAHIGNYTWDTDKATTTWSDELYRIVGHEPQHFKPSYENYINCVHPDDRPWFRKLTEYALHKKGRYSGEYRIMRPTGEVRYVLEEGEVLIDSNNTTSLVGVIHDITERKIAITEQDRLQRELSQARKMEALGKLTGGIAHDFNNMLAIIIGYKDLALDRYRDTIDPTLKSYLENIEQASYRARDLISKMMVFSRSTHVENSVLPLDKTVKDIIEMLRSIIPSSIKIELACEDNLPMVVMDTVQLQQIMMNLCINAKDAMNSKGTLRICLNWFRNVNKECIACHKHIFGNWIDLSVSDTGSGMSPAIVERIFEPFFTTKGVGEGTGMGMSILHAIVDSHNGHILIDTEVNKGTTFHLLFPPAYKIPEDDSPLIEHQLIPDHQGHGEHILIIDDEQPLSDFLADMLNSYGYKCTTYTQSTNALKHFQNQPENYDLLISDQTMPELTGVEMITQMRKLKPQLPVILMTGYSDMIDRNKAEKMGINYFINKPINSTQLLQYVADALKIKRKGLD